jgi:hypothetical protein
MAAGHPLGSERGRSGTCNGSGSKPDFSRAIHYPVKRSKGGGKERAPERPRRKSGSSVGMRSGWRGELGAGRCGAWDGAQNQGLRLHVTPQARERLGFKSLCRCLKSARIVAAEVANGFVLAAHTFEVYEVYKPASVYEHMKEQTQPCQHRGTSWSRALKKCGRCRVFKQCCLHPDVTDITEHGDAPHRRLRRIVRRYLQIPKPNPENQSARKVAMRFSTAVSNAA